MISISGAVTVVIYFLIAGLIFGLLWWLADYVHLPEPFNKFIHVALAILAVMVIIGILLSVIGGQSLFRP